MWEGAHDNPLFLRGWLKRRRLEEEEAAVVDQQPEVEHVILWKACSPTASPDLNRNGGAGEEREVSPGDAGEVAKVVPWKSSSLGSYSRGLLGLARELRQGQICKLIH